MLAYAANRPSPGKRQSSPNAMLLVVSAHVALLAAVMSAKMDLPRRLQHGPPLIQIKVTPPPKTIYPPPQQGLKSQHLLTRQLHSPEEKIKLAPIAPNPMGADPALSGGAELATDPTLTEVPVAVATATIRHEPNLLTRLSDLKPPYPPSKLASGEEATLRLRLTIDERGRVISAEPLGQVDSAFLDAARRYILAHWRYEPATVDGRPVAASVVITLRFELDG